MIRDCEVRKEQKYSVGQDQGVSLHLRSGAGWVTVRVVLIWHYET